MLFCSLGLEHLSKHSWPLWKLPNPDELIRARGGGGGSWRLEPTRSSPGGPVANVRGCWASAGEAAARGGWASHSWGLAWRSQGGVAGALPLLGAGSVLAFRGLWMQAGSLGTAQPGSEREQKCDTGTSSIHLRAALWELARPAGASLRAVALLFIEC